MTNELTGPASGDTVSFYRPGSDTAESATIASRFDDGDVPMATLNFSDGTVLTVPLSEIQG